MADDTGVRKILDAAWRSPFSAGTLIAVIVGGSMTYSSMVSNAKDAAIRDQVQDSVIKELKDRVERAEALNTNRFDQLRKDIGDMRSDVREINANIRWLAKGAKPLEP